MILTFEIHKTLAHSKSSDDDQDYDMGSQHFEHLVIFKLIHDSLGKKITSLHYFLLLIQGFYNFVCRL